MMLEEARAIGDALVASAAWHRDRCTWLARPVLAGDPMLVPTMAPLGPTLYGGSAGVALFLGRLATATGDASTHRAALGAARHALHHAPLEGPRREGYYGGALGIAWIAHELGLEAETRRIVRALHHHRKGAREHDLTYGSAGAIPTLLRLGQEGVPLADELARHLGEDLLASARRSPEGLSWPTTAIQVARDLAGFSHGASGMGLALATLWRATGQERYHEASLAAFRYERVAFDGAAQDWMDLRVATPRFQGRWCHGAPGVGMARALAMPFLKEPAVAEEMRVARAATARTLAQLLELPGEDATPCCGLGGVVESLWAMDAALGDADALSRARAVGAHLAARFGADAQRRWPAFVTWPTNVAAGADPGLMQGVAGIGSFYLRLHAGGSMPSVLAPPMPDL